MPIILHIARKSDWERSRGTDPYEPGSLRSEGFIHCSSPTQVVRVANALFRGTEDLLLLVIDAERCEAEVRWENLYGGDELFPHLYGPLNLSAVEQVLPFPPARDGTFELPESLQSRS